MSFGLVLLLMSVLYLIWLNNSHPLYFCMMAQGGYNYHYYYSAIQTYMPVVVTLIAYIKTHAIIKEFTDQSI